MLVGRSQSKNSVIDDKDVKNSQLVTKAKKNGNKKEIEEKPLNKNVNIKQVVDKPLSKIINTKRVDDKIVNKSLNTKQIEEKLVNSGRVNKLDNKIK